MSSFFTRRPLSSNKFIEELPASTQFLMGQASQDVWVRSPFSSLQRYRQLQEAQQGKFHTELDPISQRHRDWRDEPDSAVLEIEEQQEVIDAAGLTGRLKPEAGRRERALDLLVEWKRDEIAAQSAQQRTRGLQHVATIGAGLVASVADPINLASAFVPVYGQARIARSLALAGQGIGARAAVRAQVGATEALVGAALVEPIVALQASKEQADYGMYEVMANLVFGTIAGAALRPIGGAVFDRTAGPSPDEVFFRAAEDARPGILRETEVPSPLGRVLEPVNRAVDRLTAPVRNAVDELNSTRARYQHFQDNVALAVQDRNPTDLPTAEPPTLRQVAPEEAERLTAASADTEALRGEPPTLEPVARAGDDVNAIAAERAAIAAQGPVDATQGPAGSRPPTLSPASAEETARLNARRAMPVADSAEELNGVGNSRTANLPDLEDRISEFEPEIKRGVEEAEAQKQLDEVVADVAERTRGLPEDDPLVTALARVDETHNEDIKNAQAYRDALMQGLLCRGAA